MGNAADMKLIVFTPLEDEGTARKLDRLLRDRPSNAVSRHRGRSAESAQEPPPGKS